MITTTTPLGQNLADIVRGLCAVLRLHAARTGPLSALLSFIHNRIVRVVLRLDHLALCWQAGTLPTPRPARIRAPGIAKPPQFQVPSGYAWLIRLAQPTVHFGSHIQIFLMDPQTQALVAAAPQAGRMLRPWCRMLAIEIPAYLRLPPRPRASRAGVPRAKPTPAPAATIHQAAIPQGTPDRPIPPYILAAARAWRKYDL